MIKVLPSINCHFKDNEAVAAQIREIEGIFAKAGSLPEERMVHFDVADGTFAFHKSWNEPERLASLKPAFQFEVHLMAENPKTEAERWIAAGASRIIAHLEAAPLPLFMEMADMARKSRVEIVLALNPETPITEAVPYFGYTSSFMILAVHPGLSGQKFLPLVLDKVSFLRREVRDAKIEVDGGINIETARMAIAAGADSIVSGSDILGNANPEGEYETLRAI